MTYSTTHLGIGIVLIYMLFPKEIKSYLKHNPRTFFYTSLGAILPDLDLLTNGHRAYGHSVFFPLIIMLVSPLLEQLREKENLAKNLRIFGIFWLSHLIYDTTFGPMALFFPIDPRFYDIQAGIVFYLATAIILPMGFFLDVTIIDQSTGVDTFFVNWTASDRVQYFGSSTINWPISDFFLHTTIFFFYIYFVLIPFYRQKFGEGSNKETYETSDEKNEWKYIKILRTKLKMSRTQLFSLGTLFMISVALFYAGPYHGSEWIDRQEDTGSLYIIQDNLQVVIDKSIKVPTNSELTGNLVAENENFNYSIFVAYLSDSQVIEIRENVSEITELYNNQSISFIEFTSRYQDSIGSLLNRHNGSVSIQEINSTKAATWSFTSRSNVQIIIGVYKWDQGTSLINTLTMNLVWNVDISSIFWRAFTLLIITIVVIISFVIYCYKFNELT